MADRLKISCYDPSFGTEVNKFLEQIMTTNVHDGQKILTLIQELNNTFNMDGQTTREAILGALMIKAIYYRQVLDGTHEELSHREEPNG